MIPRRSYTLAVTRPGNLTSLPAAKIAVFQACELDLTLRLPTGETFDGATQVRLEIHTSQTSDPDDVLTSFVVDSPTGNTLTLGLTGDYLNHTFTGPLGEFWLNIVAHWEDTDRIEPLRCANLFLHRHNASLTTPPPPAGLIPYVRFDIAQTGLTTQQKTQARTNISAASESQVNDLQTEVTNLASDTTNALGSKADLVNGLVPANQLPAATGGTWGSITGTLSAQNDLQSALDAKASLTGVETLTNKTLTAPVLGTPVSGALTNCTSIPGAQITGNIPIAQIATALKDITTASAVSAPAVKLSGSIFTGGTGTTTTPHFLFQPTGAIATTNWNTAGTVAGINVGSGFTGNFLDFRKDGGLIARLSSDGNFECGQMLGLSGFGVRYDTGYNGVQCSNTDGMGISWSTSAAATSGKHVGIYGYQSEPGVVQVNSTVKGVFRDIQARMFKPDSTITAGGTTGAQTINKAAGSVNFAAAATSLVVTNSLVTAISIIIATIQTGDTTFTSIKAVVPASGSFTIYANAAATAETRVSFLVLS